MIFSFAIFEKMNIEKTQCYALNINNKNEYYLVSELDNLNNLIEKIKKDNIGNTIMIFCVNKGDVNNKYLDTEQPTFVDMNKITNRILYKNKIKDETFKTF
jgi:hypothetical protein